jgi:methylated-DNA-[protein]-cysteine S-methyltransferase
MKYALCKTKLGWAGIGIEGGKICALTLPGSQKAAREELARAGAFEPADAAKAAPLIDLVRRAAEGEDVDGDVKRVVRLVGGTPFQRSVWKAMLSIPHGGTIPYAELARRVGRPGAARAVGQAVGSNPIPLLIPCDRVVGSDGGLGGFGGGLPMKRRLLRQEGVAV